MCRLPILLFTLGLSVWMGAQSSPAQTSRTLLQFLKPGDLVGVQSVDGTVSVVISVYAKKEYQIAQLILQRGRRTTNALQFAAESELVKQSLNEFLSNSRNTGLVEDKLDVMPLLRTSLGTVLEIGDDYVMVEIDGDYKRRCVIAKSSIGKIYLNANPIRFSGPRHVARSSDR